MLKRTRERAEKIVGEAMLPGEQGKLGRANLETLLPQLKTKLRALEPISPEDREADMLTREGQKNESDMRRDMQEEALEKRREDLQRERQGDKNLADWQNKQREETNTLNREGQKNESEMRKQMQDDAREEREQQLGWEAEGGKNRVAFEEKREGKEKQTAEGLTGGMAHYACSWERGSRKIRLKLR